MRHICKNGGNNVNYEKPRMELLFFERLDVVTMSEGKDDTSAGEQLGWGDF